MSKISLFSLSKCKEITIDLKFYLVSSFTIRTQSLNVLLHIVFRPYKLDVKIGAACFGRN